MSAVREWLGLFHGWLTELVWWFLTYLITSTAIFLAGVALWFCLTMRRR